MHERLPCLQVEFDGGELQVLSHRGIPLNLQAGRVQGLLEAFNRDIPSVQEELNLVVSTLAAEVNAIHEAGYGLDGESTGIGFFKAIEDNGVPAALQFSVNEDILQNPFLIAAASDPGEPGNGGNALELARLRTPARRPLRGLQSWNITGAWSPPWAQTDRRASG